VGQAWSFPESVAAARHFCQSMKRIQDELGEAYGRN
jgi:hypothetical protein